MWPSIWWMKRKRSATPITAVPDSVAATAAGASAPSHGPTYGMISTAAAQAPNPSAYGGAAGEDAGDAEDPEADAGGRPDDERDQRLTLDIGQERALDPGEQVLVELAAAEHPSQEPRQAGRVEQHVDRDDDHEHQVEEALEERDDEASGPPRPPARSSAGDGRRRPSSAGARPASCTSTLTGLESSIQRWRSASRWSAGVTPARFSVNWSSTWFATSCTSRAMTVPRSRSRPPTTNAKNR